MQSEGMAVGLVSALAYQMNSAVTIMSALVLSFGIAIQNIPEGIAVSFTMLEENKTKGQAFLYGVVSAIVEPIFGFIMVLYANQLKKFMPILLAIAAGTMFYVVVNELIPDSKMENRDSGVISFMIGFVVMMFLDVILG